MKQIVFQGRLNFDTTPKFFGDESYINARNVIFQTSKDGQGGLLRLYPGFLESVGAMINNATVIGSYEDRVNRLCYFFVSNSTEYAIYKYNPDTNTHTQVFTWNGLNWNQKITGIGMIGDYLYWVDPIPRYINVTRNYTNINARDISLIRPAGLYPLQFTLTEDLNLTASSLTGNSYQFSYRYVYLDNQTSVLAPYTRTVTVEENISEVVLSKANLESVPNLVREIEIVVRKSDWDFWQVFRTLEVSDFLNNDIIYTGDELGRTIARIETTKPFENIPIFSKALEIARDRVFIGNNTEGYDRYEIPTLNALVLQVDIPSDIQNLEVWVQQIDRYEELYNPDGGVIDAESTQFFDYWLKDNIEDKFYFFKRGNDYTGDETTATVDPNSFSTTEQLEYTFQEGELGVPPVYFTETSTITKVEPEHLITTNLEAPDVVGLTKFKNKSQYRIGIVFYDRYLRNQGVYTNENCVVFIDDDFRNGDVKTIKWELQGGLIPEWAESYSIVRTDNISKTVFLQGKTSDILWVYGDNKYSRTFRADADFIEIDISGAVKSGVGYTFTEGDFIEVNGIDYRLVGQFGNRLRINSVDNADFETASPVELFFEIYTRRQVADETLFYEVGEFFKINNPGQSFRTFSTFTGFLRGDVYVIETDNFKYNSARNPDVNGDISLNDIDTTPETIVVESMNLERGGEWIKDLGRINAILDTDRTIKKSAIRFSNRFVQGTRVNGTSAFDFGDEEVLGIEIGGVNKLQLVSKTQQEGTVMLALCEVEAVSLYLGETQFVDNAGQEIIGSSQRVIGTVNPLNSNAGTNTPESVVFHNGRCWWWNRYGWRWMRYDPNGVRDISEIGAKSYFYRKGDNPIAGFDPFHKLLMTYFDDPISFDENDNSWRSFYDFQPEYFGKAENYLISFKNGIPYKSNSDNVATYFNEENVGIFEFYLVFESPYLLNNIGIYMTPNSFDWVDGFQEMNDILVVTVTNDKGQETNLIHTDFESTENVAYAHFLRDINSSGGLLEGDEMRSDVFKVKLELRGQIGIETIIFNDNRSSGQI